MLLHSCYGLTPLAPVSTPTDTPSPTLTLSPSPTLTPTATVTLTPIPSPEPVRVTFKAADGRELVGYYFPAWKPNAPVVVLMHQFEGSQALWHQSPLIAWMQNWPTPDPSASPTPSANGLLPLMPPELSFAVFTFDFRGHGESLPDDIIPDGYAAHAQELLMDAQAAYQTARQMPGVNPDQVIGLGASIGGDAAVDTCNEGCLGAFSISAGSWLGVDYGQAAGGLVSQGKPVRCMYSVNDGPTAATCWNLAPDDTYKILAYPGKKHGMEFVILPRKMQPDFGVNLLEFLQAAIQ